MTGSDKTRPRRGRGGERRGEGTARVGCGRSGARGRRRYHCVGGFPSDASARIRGVSMQWRMKLPLRDVLSSAGAGSMGGNSRTQSLPRPQVRSALEGKSHTPGEDPHSDSTRMRLRGDEARRIEGAARVGCGGGGARGRGERRSRPRSKHVEGCRYVYARHLHDVDSVRRRHYDAESVKSGACMVRGTERGRGCGILLSPRPRLGEQEARLQTGSDSPPPPP